MHQRRVISAPLLLFLALSFPLPVHSQPDNFPVPVRHSVQAPDTSVVTVLDSTVIITVANNSGLRESGRGVVFDAELSAKLPHLLGSSDPMRHIQYLPWVQTTSEQDSGIRINGCENSQNFVNIDGIPIYGSQHLLGLFSVFIPSHFDKMEVLSSAQVSSRIGGEVTMSSQIRIPERCSFDLSAGLMESDMTVGLPLGRKSAVYVSARRSYLNLLYGKLITIDDVPLLYNLTDVNVTAVSAPGARDRLQADFYFGRDKIGYAPVNYDLNIDGEWGNLVGGVSWKHSFGEAVSILSAYCSRFGSGVDISLSSKQLNLSSTIMDIGLRAEVQCEDGFSSGASMSWYRIEPQSISSYVLDNSFESTLWVAQKHDFAYWLRATCMLKGECYKGAGSGLFWGFSPFAELVFLLSRAGSITVGGGLKHQYLFQTGISNTNLPLEFWLPAGKYSDPQQSLEASVSYKCDIAQGLFTISSDLYYKRLRNQLDYYGDLFSMAETSYDLQSHLMRGYGFNYGASLLFRKNAGKLTGWVCYTFSQAKRHFDDISANRLFPSSHERPHEFKMLAVYSIGRWDFSGTFVCASGTPFTPVRSFYIASGRLLNNFGEYNSARLPAYVRLDLSATLHLSDKRNNGFNFSLYNATCRDNPVMYRLTYDLDKGTFSYSPMSLVMSCLPSVSYFHKF